MHVLLSNDDGCQAPGLQVLRAALATQAQVTVVAPDRNRSGASHSLTLDVPLQAREVAPGIYCVDGTPTDCVHLAITGLLENEPDIVISGINEGPNLGDDVLYSGTVAAAMEGRSLGFPAIAVSMGSHAPAHYATAGAVVLQLLERLRCHPLDSRIILNLNVPDVPLNQLAGLQVTRLGHRHKAEPVVKSINPRGKIIYWVGPAGPEEDAGPGTDFYALREGCASLTPLHVDLTRHQALEPLRSWLAE